MSLRVRIGGTNAIRRARHCRETRFGATKASGAAVLMLSIMPIAISSNAGGSAPTGSNSPESTPGANSARPVHLSVPAAPYAFNVVAHNSAGGGASTTLNAVTPEAPSTTTVRVTTATTTTTTTTSPTTTTTLPPEAASSLVVPLYDANLADWMSTCSSLSSSNSFVVADIGDPGGPGTSSSSGWAQNFSECASAHVGVLGYVDSGYCQVPLATVESQIDSWYDWYAGVGLDGIFVDEAANPVSPTSHSDCLSGTASAVAYYHAIAAYAHSEGPDETVTLNFGANPVSGWALSSAIAAQNADILVIFESPYSQYVNYANTGEPWTAATWESSYPARDFSVLVYDASGASLPGSFCAAVAQQNVGFTYVSPYDGWFAPAPNAYLVSGLTDC